MRFENTFAVGAPIDEVYDTLMDVERVAPCMPGAQVLERSSDDAFKVAIKVKVGPMTMTYRGDVEVVSRDPQSHAARMKVAAREARGQGTATADVAMSLAESGGGTHATIDTDVRLSGRAAAMGQGVIGDVSARLVEQFADNLAQMLSGTNGQPSAPPPAVGTPPAPPREAGFPPVPGEPAKPPPPPAPPPPPRPREESLDVLSIAGSVAAERLRDPRVFAGALLLATLVGYALGRRRARV